MIDEGRIDPRDANWAAGILAYSSAEIGADNKVFLEAAALATPAIAEM